MNGHLVKGPAVKNHPDHVPHVGFTGNLTMNRFVALLSLILSAAILSPPSLAQQPGGLLPSREAFKLYKQIGDHMEATSLAVPELARAGAPLIENVRQASDALQIGATREHSGLIYKLTRNARIYLDIADAVPTTNPFAAEVERQLIELRQAVQRVEIHFLAQLGAKEDRLRGSDRDNLRRYSQQNRELGLPQPDEKRVVFLGDSITDGWPLNQYFPSQPYVNRGIGGQITSQMLARMKADVLDLKPTVMVVLAGTNDIARGVSTDIIKNNLSMIADLAVAHEIAPVFASILPVSDHHEENDPNYKRTPARPPSTILELNAWIRRMCEVRDFVYLDYFSGTVDSGGYLQAAFADDGLHPNAEGYRVMTPLAHRAVNQALRARAPSSKKKRFGIF